MAFLAVFRKTPYPKDESKRTKILYLKNRQ